MHDPAPYRDPKGSERWIVLAAVVIAIGALIAIVLEDYEPVKLAPLFMVLAWFPLIALHEGGHALAAKLVGWHVESIVVGLGAPIVSFSIAGIPVTIKTYPIAGYVLPAPIDLRSVRLKSAIVFAAGPAIELALASAIAAILGARLFMRTDDVAIIAAQAVAIAATIGAVSNLVPRSIQTERGTGWTDGLGVIMSLARSKDVHARQLLDRYERRLDDLAELSLIDELVSTCESAHRAFPNEPHLRSAIRLAIAKVRRDKHQRAALDEALEGRTFLERSKPDDCV